MSPSPSWNPPNGKSPPEVPRGCLGGWFELLKRPKQPEDSIPLRVGVGFSVGIAILAALHQMEWPFFGWAVMGLTLLGSLFSWYRRTHSNWLLKAILSILMLLVLFNFLVSLAATPYDPRFPLAELLLWLLTLHSFDLPARKDLKYSMLVGIILISFGAVLSSSLGYGAYLAAFLAAGLVVMHLFWRSEAREGARTIPVSPGEAVRPGFPIGVIGMLLRSAGVIMLIGLVAFALMPRYESMKLRNLPVSWSMRLTLPRIARGEIVNPSYPGQMSRGLPHLTFSPDNYAGFAPIVDLNLRGVLSDELIMQVRTSRWSYYRGLAFLDYDGRYWSLSEEEPVKVTSLTPPITLPLRRTDFGNDERLVQIFYVQRELPNVIFAPFEPYQVFFPSEDLYVDQALGLRAPFPLEEGMIYSVIGLTRPLPAEELKKLPPLEDFPQLARSASTHLTERVPQRVRDLAFRLTAPYKSPYEKALALTLHLQNRYSYQSPPPAYPADAEVSDYFLFESRTGHCEQFATALVVMARSLGMPARYVTGYLPGNFNPFTGFYEVRGSQAHAWAEIYLPGFGWMAFDPTPTGNGEPTPGLQSRPHQHWMLGALIDYLKGLVPETRRVAATRALAQVRSRWGGWIAVLKNAGLPTAVAVALLLLIPLQIPFWIALVALWRARRTGRWNPLTRSLERATRSLTSLLGEPSLSPRENLQNIYHQMERLLQRAGWERPAQKTTREFVAYVQEKRDWPEMEPILEGFEKARYGEIDPSPEDQDRAHEALRRLRHRLSSQVSVPSRIPSTEEEAQSDDAD
jgi:transglutaminase-like putative cysteine protease